MEDRKKDHIDLAFESQTLRDQIDRRFEYEPMLSAHPEEQLKPFTFLGKEHRVPMWVSSMTGGTKMAGTINKNLARACNEFGMGMGLGSCRILLEDDRYLADFDVRDVIGDELPLYANLGINQVEKMLEEKQLDRIEKLLDQLRSDGLIIHVNPLQEWFQPEGDRLFSPAIEVIESLLDKVSCKIIVKEVGQGFGRDSMKELLQLPLEAIEFAAFGGTNFAKVELLRNPQADPELYEPLTRVGKDACSMLDTLNELLDSGLYARCKQVIISGGVKTYLDGYYLVKRSRLPAVYGQASTFLKHAREDYESLKKFIQNQVKGLQMAYAFLRIKD